jgi:hypothetical protein
MYKGNQLIAADFLFFWTVVLFFKEKMCPAGCDRLPAKGP